VEDCEGIEKYVEKRKRRKCDEKSWKKKMVMKDK
jgi:hypothetical protein